MTAKGPGEAHAYDGSTLRIGIIHGRWNSAVTESLITGTKKALQAANVPPTNIITQSIPGSYELPYAAQRMITASQTTTSTNIVSAAADLLGTGIPSTNPPSTSEVPKQPAGSSTGVGSSNGKGIEGPLDAVIAIGVLIKGSTMHFEYIADAVSHGLMKVQLETGTPVVFGVLTCLNEEQARVRAGLGEPAKEGDRKGGEGKTYAEQGHNHGEDWGRAAVEMAVKRRGWGEGRFVD